MNIKFIVSSCKKYFENTFLPVCNSLIASGILPDDIYFFVGGYDEYEKIENELNVNLYHVDHNSMDFTALISVIDLNLEADYWFLLHDTIIVGPTFYSKVKDKELKENPIPLTTDGFSMSMGIYPKNTIINNKSEILKIKNKDYSDQGLQQSKTYAINNEDRFLQPRTDSFNTSHRICKYDNPTDYYGYGVHRVQEYFPDIDVLKIKANWGPGMFNISL